MVMLTLQKYIVRLIGSKQLVLQSSEVLKSTTKHSRELIRATFSPITITKEGYVGMPNLDSPVRDVALWLFTPTCTEQQQPSKALPALISGSCLALTSAETS